MSDTPSKLPTPSKIPAIPKPFKCTMCALEYTTKSSLTAHVKKKHSKELPRSQSTTTQDPAKNATPEPDDTAENVTVDQENVHDTDEDLNVENEVMEEAIEDQELYDVLDHIGQVYEEDDKEDEANILKEKLERIKLVIKRKAYIIKTMKTERDNLSKRVDELEAGGSRCYECGMKDQVISNMDSSITKKEKEIKVEERKNWK